MTEIPLFLITHDAGLAKHWQAALVATSASLLSSFAELGGWELPAGAVVWIDADLPDLPHWDAPEWVHLRGVARLVLASSNPQRPVAIAALEQGFAAYCHAYADFEMLRQILGVVASGNVWIGQALMQQLLRSVQLAAQPATPRLPDWVQGLTEREQEIARLAANGASNREIAVQCSITERTVKAHLAASFAKLGVTDRLQLALRVHGIR
ncbi:response regulator transcription factor [Chitinimonas sp. BJB300]|uniref:response regulator transcription factor n=1 Tax=Chitinimonas sp. BJB300 TaxID=1559339 RepID=UPI000C0FFEF1|nr:response regulator transcription factor [Chitinimonas sp. BJB300]PHV11384.1 helix-turn-helix transcriptional regulator [Chitinimonas sp. BJB300]TSJ88897.1 response regulator transcription factor [Chitinimonas sp. BJB300]